MTDYFYGERSDSREDIEQLNNMHSVALDDAEVSFPLSEEVRSYPEVATRSSNNFRPAILHLTRKRRNVWIVTALVGVILVVMIPAIIVSKRNRSERDTSNSFISDMVSESPPRPPIAAVIEYFLTESVTDASFFQDITSPQYKAARWLSEEDPANLSIPSVFTQHMDGYFYMFRYIMAINYFALGGEQWFHQLSFLSVEHVCRWNSGKAATLGVVCYKEDGLFVPVELILSKCY